MVRRLGNLGTLNPLCLEKTFQLDVTPRSWRYERVRAVVREMLAENPDAKSIELVAHMESEHGLRVCEATVSRVRHDLGLAPGCQQSRAAKARRNKTD